MQSTIVCSTLWQILKPIILWRKRTIVPLWEFHSESESKKQTPVYAIHLCLGKGCQIIIILVYYSLLNLIAQISWISNDLKLAWLVSLQREGPSQEVKVNKLDNNAQVPVMQHFCHFERSLSTFASPTQAIYARCWNENVEACGLLSPCRPSHSQHQIQPPPTRSVRLICFNTLRERAPTQQLEGNLIFMSIISPPAPFGIGLLQWDMCWLCHDNNNPASLKSSWPQFCTAPAETRLQILIYAWYFDLWNTGRL